MTDTNDHPRSAFLKRTAVGLAAATLGTALAQPMLAEAAAMQASPHRALERLMAGNERFVTDRSICGPYRARRAELVNSQSPFVVILGCSDSRVPLETVFDQMPGDIFGVRIAGNFADDNGLGSIEYAIAVLKAQLIMVLGHSNCGAISAAVNYVKDGTTVPGHIQGLVEAIAPAAKESRAESGDWKHNAILRNVRNNASAISARSTIVSDAIKVGKLSIVGGMYELGSGKVNLISG